MPLWSCAMSTVGMLPNARDASLMTLSRVLLVRALRLTTSTPNVTPCSLMTAPWYVTGLLSGQSSSLAFFPGFALNWISREVGVVLDVGLRAPEKSRTLERDAATRWSGVRTATERTAGVPKDDRRMRSSKAESGDVTVLLSDLVKTVLHSGEGGFAHLGNRCFGKALVLQEDNASREWVID